MDVRTDIGKARRFDPRADLGPRRSIEVRRSRGRARAAPSYEASLKGLHSRLRGRSSRAALTLLDAGAASFDGAITEATSVGRRA